MNLTAHHAKYFAHELTKRCSSDSIEKLAGALVDAQVDLNPHQIEAAVFAFHSPLSKGALLADEVGLGKTIEAGLVLSQKWAEGTRSSRLRSSQTGLRSGDRRGMTVNATSAGCAIRGRFIGAECAPCSSAMGGWDGAVAPGDAGGAWSADDGTVAAAGDDCRSCAAAAGVSTEDVVFRMVSPTPGGKERFGLP